MKKLLCALKKGEGDAIMCYKIVTLSALRRCGGYDDEEVIASDGESGFPG